MRSGTPLDTRASHSDIRAQSEPFLFLNIDSGHLAQKAVNIVEVRFHFVQHRPRNEVGRSWNVSHTRRTSDNEDPLPDHAVGILYQNDLQFHAGLTREVDVHRTVSETTLRYRQSEE